MPGRSRPGARVPRAEARPSRYFHSCRVRTSHHCRFGRVHSRTSDSARHKHETHSSTPLAKRACVAVCALFVLSFPTCGQESPNVERFMELTRKSQTGESLTPDEQAFLERVRADIQRRRQGQRGAKAPGTPTA